MATNILHFIRADDLDIKNCTGCMGCVLNLLYGGNGSCHLKDDMKIIDEALLECDAVIVGSPTYVLSPTGKFRMVTMGKNIADALYNDKEQMNKWRGNEEGVCPVCHCDMLTVVHNKNQVECPVCGISGELEIVNGEIKVSFSEEQKKRSRLFYDGKLEHYIEISTKAVGPGQIPNKEELLVRYVGYGE